MRPRISDTGCTLYRNEGNLGFDDTTAAAGLDSAQPGRAVAVGDWDNDGDPDLYIVASGGNGLYRNDGGNFHDVTVDAGVGDAGDGYDAVWVDLDNDGDLDLYIVNDGQNILYRNDGNGSFDDASSLSGTANAGDGRAVALADYDGDGDLDLYVVNETASNVLYRNVTSGSNWLKVRLVGGDISDAPIGVQVDVDVDGLVPMSKWPDGSGADEATAHFGVGSAQTIVALSVEWRDGTTQILDDVDVNQVVSLSVPDNALYVDSAVAGQGSGTRADPYPAIQDAIDAAVDGDIIKIANGGYN